MPKARDFNSLSPKDEWLLLLIESNEGSYGLEIQKAIYDTTCDLGRECFINIGSLYPALKRLKEDGLINEKFSEDTDLKKRRGNRKKVYTITSKGREALKYLESVRFQLKIFKLEPNSA